MQANLLHRRGAVQAGWLRPAARMPMGVAPFSGRRVACEATLAESKAIPVMEKGELSQFPGSAGVYAVYDKVGELQYIGLSRKVRG
jgi:hypothetical protein